MGSNESVALRYSTQNPVLKNVDLEKAVKGSVAKHIFGMVDRFPLLIDLYQR